MISIFGEEHCPTYKELKERGARCVQCGEKVKMDGIYPINTDPPRWSPSFCSMDCTILALDTLEKMEQDTQQKEDTNHDR